MKPTKLHDLLGYQAEWTDELWEEAMHYLSENISSVQMPVMEELLPEFLRTPSYFKTDASAPFREFPPALMLAAYDWLRIHRRAESRLAELGRRYPVNQRGFEYYDRLIPRSLRDRDAA